MTGAEALVEITGLTKDFGALRPLRIQHLRVARADRLAIAGLDEGAAEMFVHLVTGASLPSEGDISLSGVLTRDISTDTDWLASLDRFGIVTARAVLLDQLTLQQNLALPFTLSVDPVPPEIASRVAALSEEVGLGRGALGAKVGDMDPAGRVRVHLARALAPDPEVLLLEHATASLAAGEAAALGRTISALAAARRLAFVALTEDAAFADALGATRLRLDPATGRLRGQPWWRSLLP